MMIFRWISWERVLCQIWIHAKEGGWFPWSTYTITLLSLQNLSAAWRHNLIQKSVNMPGCLFPLSLSDRFRLQWKRWQGFSPTRVQKSTGVRTTTNTLNMWWSTLTLYVSCVCTPAVLSILNSLFLNDSQKEDWLICDCFMCSYRWAALFSSLYLPSCSTFCTLMPKRGTWQFTWSGPWWYS